MISNSPWFPKFVLFTLSLCILNLIYTTSYLTYSFYKKNDYVSIHPINTKIHHHINTNVNATVDDYLKIYQKKSKDDTTKSIQEILDLNINSYFKDPIYDLIPENLITLINKSFPLTFDQESQLRIFLNEQINDLKEEEKISQEKNYKTTDLFKLHRLNRKATLRDFLRNLIPIQFNENDYDLKTGKLEPSGLKIAIVSATDGKGAKSKNMFKQVYQNRQEYCDYHGYINAWYNLSHYEYPKDRGREWGKVEVIRKAFDDFPSVEWVYILDIDVIIMDYEIDLAELVLHPKALKNRLSYAKTLRRDYGGRPRYVNQLYGILEEEEDNLNNEKNYLNFNGTKHISLNDSIKESGFENGLNDLPPIDLIKDEDIYNIDVIMGLELSETNTGSFFFRRSDFTRHFLSYWDIQSSLDLKLWLKEQSLISEVVVNNPILRKKFGVVSIKTIGPILNIHHNDLEYTWTEGDWIIHFAGFPMANGEQWSRFWVRRRRVPIQYRISGIPEIRSPEGWLIEAYHKESRHNETIPKDQLTPLTIEEIENLENFKIDLFELNEWTNRKIKYNGLKNDEFEKKYKYLKDIIDR